MHRPSETSQPTATLLTSPGSGGIGVMLVWGPGSVGVVGRVFRPRSEGRWHAEPTGGLHYGHVADRRGVVDEVIVRLVSVGDGEVVEINCHGGIVAAGEVMRLLVENGAVEGLPTDAPAAQGGLDGVQAEAGRLLPRAETRLAVRVLCDQLAGALSDRIRALLCGPPEAPGELRRLAASAEFGLALTRPHRVALAGRPNAGKSTLFNALVGHHRTIVSPTPGTTRDFVCECIAVGGYPVELIDTAGLRKRGGMVEMKGVEASWAAVSAADLIVVVIDGSTGPCPDDRSLLDALAGRRPIVVLNKADVGVATGAGELGDVCRVSALTGEGLAALERAILDRLPDPSDYAAGATVAFTVAQADALRKAADQYEHGNAGEGHKTLAELLGSGSSRGVSERGQVPQ